MKHKQNHKCNSSFSFVIISPTKAPSRSDLSLAQGPYLDDISNILEKEYGTSYPKYNSKIPLEILFANIASDSEAPIISPEMYCFKTSVYTPLDIVNQTSMSKDQYLYATRHYNAEEIVRAERANLLHECLGHPSDDRMIAGLNQGYYTYANITAADVRINRILRGPCPDCLQAKMKNPSMPSSETEPARHNGQILSFDPDHLPVPTDKGYKASVKVVDEKTGAYFFWLAEDYKAPQLARSIVKGILECLNVYGWKKCMEMQTE
jgi:hypothetical protein